MQQDRIKARCLPGLRVCQPSGSEHQGWYVLNIYTCKRADIFRLILDNAYNLCVMILRIASGSRIVGQGYCVGEVGISASIYLLIQ